MSDSSVASPIPQELIQTLAVRFPDSVPDINDSDREVGAKIGEQRIIRWLRHEYELQNENIL